MKYRAKQIYLDDMGIIPETIVEDKPMESKEEEYLWHINKMREHDGLKPLDEIPDNTVFEFI